MKRLSLKCNHGIWFGTLGCVLIAAVGSGCTSIAGTVDGWVGKPVSELVAAWGEPDSTVTLEEGDKVLTWVDFDGPGDVLPCRWSFTVSPDGIVEKISASDCPPDEPAGRHRLPDGKFHVRP